MRKRRGPHRRVVPGLVAEGSPLGKEMASGAQASGAYTEGAEVSRGRTRRGGAGKPSNKGPSPHPLSQFSLSLGTGQAHYSPLLALPQGLLAEAFVSWLTHWFVVWK